MDDFLYLDEFVSDLEGSASAEGAFTAGDFTDRPLFDTPFEDYTVSEGLLLMLLLFGFFAALASFVGRFFCD